MCVHSIDVLSCAYTVLRATWMKQLYRQTLYCDLLIVIVAVCVCSFIQFRQKGNILFITCRQVILCKIDIYRELIGHCRRTLLLKGCYCCNTICEEVAVYTITTHLPLALGTFFSFYYSFCIKSQNSVIANIFSRVSQLSFACFKTGISMITYNSTFLSLFYKRKMKKQHSKAFCFMHKTLEIPTFFLVPKNILNNDAFMSSTKIVQQHL